MDVGALARRPIGPSAMPPSTYNLVVPPRWECIGTVASPGATFTNTTYLVNPGNSVTFPWLSGIATKFEKYRFISLRFCFVSTSADAVGSTNTALGSVLVNTNYDVLDAAFASQTQFEDYGGAAEGKPSEDLNHVLNVRGRRGGEDGARFVLPSSGTSSASAGYPTNSSAHDYDLGLLQVATVGQQASSTVGRLYVEYSVELIRAKTDVAAGVLVAGHSTATAATTAAPIPSNLAVVSGSTVSPTRLSGTTFSLPTVGRFQVCMAWTGASITSAATIAFTAGCTSVTNISGNTKSSEAAVDPGLADAILFFTVDINSTTNVLTIGGLSTMSNSKLDIFVQQVPAGLTARSELQSLRQRVDKLVELVAAAGLIDEDSDGATMVPRRGATKRS